MSARHGFILPLVIGLVVALIILGTIAYLQFRPVSITKKTSPSPTPIVASNSPQIITLDAASNGTIITTQVGTIVEVRLNNSSDWTKPESSENAVVSTIDASVASDGSANGRFRVVKQGNAYITAEGACKRPPPGSAGCNSRTLWKVTIVSYAATDKTVYTDRDIANWKTYEDQDLKYKISYPQEWTLEPGRTGGCGRVFWAPGKKDVTWISICPGPMGDSLEQISKLMASGLTTISSKETLLDSHVAIRLEVKPKNSSEIHYGSEIIAKRDSSKGTRVTHGTIEVYVWSINEIPQNTKDEFNQILSTFKFLD